VKATSLVIASIAVFLLASKQSNAAPSEVIAEFALDKLAVEVEDTPVGRLLGIRSAESIAAEEEMLATRSRFQAEEIGEEIAKIMPPQSPLEDAIRSNFPPPTRPNLETARLTQDAIGEEADLAAQTSASTLPFEGKKDPFITVNLTGKIEIGPIVSFKHVEFKGGEFNIYAFGVAGAALYYCHTQKCALALLHILTDDTMDVREVKEQVEKAQKMNEESDKAVPAPAEAGTSGQDLRLDRVLYTFF
jgi:hypothetical protein